MKNLRSVLDRFARVSLSLILCLGTLMGNVAAVVAEQPEASVIPSETYFSQEVSSQDIMPLDMGVEAAGTPVTRSLADYCSSMGIELYYTPSGGGEVRVYSGDELPRGAAVRMVLNFTLKDTVRDECNEDYTFTFNIPAGLSMTAVTARQPFYDQQGIHLMDWWSSSSVISVQFTEEFYADVRNNVEGFVSLKGTLGTSQITDGKVVYNFPADPNFTINFPPAVPGVNKVMYGNMGTNPRIAEGKLVATYAVYLYCDDNYDKVEITDVPGAEVAYPPENVEMHETTGSWPSLGNTATQIPYAKAGGTYVITGSGSVARKGHYIFLLYTIKIPLEKVVDGTMSSSTNAAARTNTATVKITDKNGKSQSAIRTYVFSYAVSNLIAVSKTAVGGGAPDSNGKLTFNISVETKFPMDQITITEVPGTYLRNGVFTDVTDPANPVVITLSADNKHVISSPVADKVYKYTYVVDFPYVEFARGLVTTTTGRNTINVDWQIGETKQTTSAYAYCVTGGNFRAPTKTVSNVASPIRISDEGDYVVDYTVTVPSSSASTYYSEVYLTDTLGSYMTLIPESVRIASNTPGIAATLASNVGKTFSIRLGGDAPDKVYHGSYTYTVYYTVKLDKDKVLAGLLSSDLTDAEIVAGRTNRVKIEWKAFGFTGQTDEATYQVIYDVPLTPMTIDKSNSGIKYLGDGTPYVDFTIHFSTTRPVDWLTIDDIKGEMFEKTAPGGWTATIKRGSTAYTGAVTIAYDKFEFTNLPAGSYSIEYRLMLAKGFNGLTYTQVLENESARTNTAIMAYPVAGGGPETVTARSVVTAYEVDIHKTGGFRSNAEGTDIEIITIPGLPGRYGILDWTVTLTTNSTNMDLRGGKLIESLMGRQCFVKNDPSQMSSFLKFENVSGYCPVSTYGFNTVGSRDYLQEFTYELGGKNEFSTARTTYTYTFSSYAQIADANTVLVATNQAVFEHPYWGRYVATAEDEYVWAGGTVPPVVIRKELVKLDPISYSPEIMATWKITIPVVTGQIITYALLTDYMNYAEPYSYFDLSKLNLTIVYEGESAGPSYSGPTLGVRDGVKCLYIEFTEDLHKTVTVTLNTYYSDIDAVGKGRDYINFADLEYMTNALDGERYTVDSDYWSLDGAILEKAGSEPRFDSAAGKYVIDWSITLKDALRVGLNTRLQDILPEGVYLLPGTVAASAGTIVSVTEGTGADEGAFVVVVKPSGEETVVTFSTALAENSLDTYQSFLNRVNLLVRDTLSNAVAATATARVECDPVRGVSKSGKVIYNEEKDRYEIVWTIKVNDETRRNQTIYLNDRLPEGLTYVAGSAVSAPVSRLQSATPSGDGVMFVIGPANSGVFEIQFTTAVADAKLTQANEIYAFRNYGDLLGSSGDIGDVVATAEGIVNLSGGVRQFQKMGYGHYDDAEQGFVIDWTIVLDEQARVGKLVTLHETLPEGLILGGIQVIAGEGGVPVAHEIKNKSADGRSFDIVLTPPLARTVITLRTYIDADLDGSERITAAYANRIDLMSRDGLTVIDTAVATVDFDTDKRFVKNVSNQAIAYNAQLGKYVIDWELNLQASLAVGRSIVIEDILPEGLSPFATGAVTCKDGTQPHALSYTYNAASRKLTINVTPSIANMTLVVHTTINDDRLFYTTTAMPEYTNVANVITYGLTGSAKATYGLRPEQALTKSVAQTSGTNVITYTVEVNKLAIDLAGGAAELVLEDVLNEHLTMLLDSVVMTDGATGNPIPAQDYQVQFNAATGLLTFRLPNSRHLKITFKALLNGTPGSEVVIGNTILLRGTAEISASTGDKSFIVQKADSGLTFDTDYVKIQKVDSADSSKTLKDARFELWLVNDDGTETKIVDSGATDLTDDNGILYLPNPTSGIAVNRLYYIREVSNPPDYLLDSAKHYFVLPGKDVDIANAAVAAIKAKYPSLTILVSRSPQFTLNNWIDLKTRIIVRKMATGTTRLLSGAELAIYDAQTGGNLIYAFTSGSVQTELENLRLGGNHLQTGVTYWLRELTPPAGYKPAQPAPFTLANTSVQYNGKTITIGYAEVTMYDDPLEIPVYKEDMYGRPVAGARLEIIDMSGAAVDSWTSAKTPYTAKALAFGAMYGLREATPPAGYFKTDTVVWFKRVDDSTLLTYTGTATPPAESALTPSANGVSLALKNKAKLEILKVDDETPSPAPVIGAKMELYVGDSAVGTPMLTWTTDGTPYVVERDLFPGKYTLHEAEAPGGYEPAVSRAITITGEETETITLSVVDKKIRNKEVTVTKHWEDNGNQDGYRTAEIKAVLTGKVNGQVVNTREATLNSGNSWTVTWDDVPVKDDKTKETIVYSVDEESVPPHYTRQVVGGVNSGRQVTVVLSDSQTITLTEEENKFHIINTHAPEKTDVTVKKVWVDNDNAKTQRPSELDIALQADGVTIETAKLTGTGWSKTWTGLPKKANGADIVYSVVEPTLLTGYVSSVKLEPAERTYLITLTNTLTNTLITKYAMVSLGESNPVYGTEGLGGARFEVWNQDKTSAVLTNLVSGADGTIDLGSALNPGDYWLVETQAPDGYYKSADIAFSVTGNDQPISVHDPATVVAIRKVDKATGQPLPGAELAIFASASETDPKKALYTFTTTAQTQLINASGRAAIRSYDYGSAVVVLEGLLKAGETYYVREISAPEGYLKGQWSFVVSGTPSLTEVKLEDEPIELFDIPVEKDWDDLGAQGVAHPEITVDLFRSDDDQTPHRTLTLSPGMLTGTFEDLYQTDADGALYTYRLEERPVTGYHSEIEGSASSGFTVTNTRTTVTVSKLTTDADGNTHPVAGAKLQIWTTGSPAVKVAEFTSSADAPENLVGVLTPGVEYELREIDLPVGFAQAAAKKFTFTGKSEGVELENKPTLVVIQKINKDGRLLPNASLEIREGSVAGAPVWSGTTTNQTQVITWNNVSLVDVPTTLNPSDGTIVLVGILEAGKTYYLVETNPPSGYVKAAEMKIVPDTTGAPTSVMMVDERDDKDYEVRIYKNDQYGDPVVGAELTLTDTANNKTYTWTTTEDPYVISLPASTEPVYVLAEITAPEGYRKAGDITFEVNVDAQSVKVGIVMIDELTDRNVHGTKTWELLGATAKPVTIQLYQDGAPYLDVNGDEVFATIPVGQTTYEFLHLPAVDPTPDGQGKYHKYVYTVVELPVAGFGSVQTGTNFKNIATKLLIEKVDEDGNPLGGAEFGLYDSTDALVGSAWNTTDENPKEFTGVLIAGATYTLKEIAPPLGYDPMGDRTITVNTAGGEQIVTVVNTQSEWKVTIRKVAMNASAEELLGGAVMGVFADGPNWRQGSPVASWNTTASNPKVFTDLDPTVVYHLAEITPPAGYLNPSDIGGGDITFSADDVDENGEITLTMTNYQTKFFVDKLAGSNHLAGAVLEIRDESGTPVRRWTSDGSSHMVLGLEVGKRYTLHEVKPPDGYARNPDAQQFIVHGIGVVQLLGAVPGTVTTVVITDIPNPSEHEGYQGREGDGGVLRLQMQNSLLDVSIDKLSGLTGQGLSGATLKLYKGTVADANLVEEWVSNGAPHKVTAALEAGASYILKEISCPDGYQRAPELRIDIADTSDPQLFEMTNHPIHVVIEKRNGPNGAFVPGARLTLLDNHTTQTVDTWTTGTGAKVFRGTLIAGHSYTLSEIDTPAGYLTADPIDFTVPMDAATETIITMVMIDHPVDAGVSKVDESGIPQGGATFALYLGDTAGGTALETWNSTASNPHKIAHPLVEGQTYTIRETSSPDGYYRAKDRTFTVGSDSGNIAIEIKDHQIRVAVHKYDEQTGWYLSGATLTLRDSTGGVVDTWTTDGSPRTPSQALIAGNTYTLHEDGAPAGYAPSDPVTFTIPEVYPGDEASSDVHVIDVNMHDPRLYHFSKIDADTGDPLGGARLYIKDENDLVVVREWTSSAAGPYEVKGTLEPGKKYTLVESQAPDGYTLAAPKEFTVGADGTLATVVMENRKSAVTIEKRDALGGSFVTGATLRLRDNVSNQIVEEWTTGVAAKVFTGLITGRSYTLTEIDTPTGYYTAEPITFTVSVDGTTPTVVMVDEPVVVEVSKVDEDGRLLSGASMSLYLGPTASGSILESWNTSDAGANPYRIAHPLVEGQTYTIRETNAPDGYFCAQNITFTVTAQRNSDGSVQKIQRSMTDYDTRVAITKYDEQTGRTLSGASLSLFDSAGTLIDSWVSGGAPHLLQGKLVAGATYTLRETAAPTGFAIADPISFSVPMRPDSSMMGVTVSGNGIPTYSVGMYDPHIYLFVKYIYGTSTPLAGATLYIRDAQGNVVVPDWISATTPHQVIGTLRPGVRYFLVEREAPAGYELAMPSAFTVSADGTLSMVHMHDRPISDPTPTPYRPGTTTFDMTVNKVWVDNNNASGKRPSEVTVQLYRKATTAAGYPSAPEKTEKLNAGNNWTATFADLPRTEGGVRYDYLVQEAPVAGYSVSYSNNGQTITNRLAGLDTPTPFATPTTPVGGGTGTTARQPVGIRFVDGEWVTYIDEYDTPLGVVPLTGDDSNWLLWIAAAVIPMLGIGVAGFEIRRRAKRKK